MNYFPPIQQAQVNVEAVKGRFMFLDRNGKTANSTDAGASDKPLGIYYYDNEVASSVSIGWVKYYGYNWSLPVYLEMASACSVDDVISFTADGRGVPASNDGIERTGYARAVESCEAGDLVHVLVQWVNQTIPHSYSNGYDWLQFD